MVNGLAEKDHGDQRRAQRPVKHSEKMSRHNISCPRRRRLLMSLSTKWTSAWNDSADSPIFTRDPWFALASVDGEVRRRKRKTVQTYMPT
ncbi:hypothetical protein BV898_15702 [Hypsibius exemplaris]|uniref:Uncharacterized protein n=1 Tax=Hypsibius exemplaris TaxID=2072580 RepID=A0A9X6NBS3_HYPEX|nr:hypothetical protein BV898_15702 [Hypsibius exemplaris]